MTPSAGSGRRTRPRVVILRGHQANPWELRQWQHPDLESRYDICFLESTRGWFDTSSVALARRQVLTMRSLLPRGRLGDLLVRLPGDRYIGLAGALRNADIVHAQEIGYWYSKQAARLKPRLGFRLALTVWETIPFLDAYRNVRTRRYRARTLAHTDVFLAATERARISLLLEGAPEERIRVCPPGVASEPRAPALAPSEQVILSPGRLVWEKGHQDVMRALALLRRTSDGQGVRLRIAGTGPEERRLRRYAVELGIEEAIEFAGFLPHDEMLRAYAEARCVVLASLPTWSWEEQFGMVLAEAAAAGSQLIASDSGAIREVAADGTRFFAPGDWIGLAGLLADVLASGDVQPASLDEHYSVDAAGARLAAAYDDLLSGAIPRAEGELANSDS